jgi:hypothetical protein
MAGAFDVFDSSGEYVGAVRLPENLQYRPFPGHTDFFIRSDTVWAMAHDSLEVEYLTKYVVEWPNANSAIGKRKTLSDSQCTKGPCLGSTA